MSPTLQVDFLLSESPGKPRKNGRDDLICKAEIETWIGSLGQEDPLEKGLATHSNILAWRIPWTEEPGGLQSMGSVRVEYD